MKKSIMKLTAVAAAVAGMSLGSVSTFAANDGALGTTGSPSVGDMDLLIIRGTIARITGMDDLDWGNVLAGDMVAGTGANGDTRISNVCVFSSTGNYSVAADSLWGSGSFVMTDGVDPLPYTVTWDEIPTNTPTGLVEEGAAVSFGGASTTDDTCGGGNTASITVVIDAVDYNTVVQDGIYGDTLTLTVAPVP